MSTIIIENSIAISILVKTWAGLKRSYRYSLFRKALNRIGEGFNYLSQGSLFISFFTSNSELIEKGLFYKIYCSFIDLMFSTVEKTRKIVNKAKRGSIINTTISKLFENKNQIYISFYVFFLFLGLTTLLINFSKGIVFTREALISIAIVLISLMSLDIKDIYEEVLRKSIIFKAIKSIFTIDEEGDKSGRKN